LRQGIAVKQNGYLRIKRSSDTISLSGDK
jgi:hypothetical protein